jgi:hypothetical protein
VFLEKYKFLFSLFFSLHKTKVGSTRNKGGGVGAHTTIIKRAKIKTNASSGIEFTMLPIRRHYKSPVETMLFHFRYQSFFHWNDLFIKETIVNQKVRFHWNTYILQNVIIL